MTIVSNMRDSFSLFVTGALVAFSHARMLTILKSTFRDFSDDECPVRAAALAYYTVFALPALLVLLLMIAGAVWDPQDVQRAMEGQFSSLVGSEGGSAIHGMIQSADKPGQGGILATVLSLGMLVFGATGAMMQLQAALNRAWEVRPDPKKGGLKVFVTKRLLSLGMILGVAFLLIVSLAMSALITAFGDSLTFIPEPALHAVSLLLNFAVLTLLFAAMFKVLPDAKIEWGEVWVGAAVTSLLFVAGKFALGLYLGRSSPGDAFGAASAFAVILVWIYYAGMILLFGAEFTQAWAQHRGAHIEPEEGAIRVERQRADGTADEKADVQKGVNKDVKSDVNRDVKSDVNRDVTTDLSTNRWNAPHTHSARRLQMDSIRRNDFRPVRPNGDGHGGNGLSQHESVGELFKRLSADSTHLMRQEINLAKVELKESGQRLGSAVSKLGMAIGIAIPGMLALTAFLVIGLGDLIESYWAGALIVAVVLLVVAGIMATKAMANLKGGVIAIPETAGTLREDSQWAKQEVQAFKREFTA